MEPLKKVISPIAINALSEALANIYWYKNDLQSFLFNTISNPELLSGIDWSDYKRNIVLRLIAQLAKHQEIYKDDLVNLMVEVCRMEDYSHLEQLDGGADKAKKAKQTVEALRKQIKGHIDLPKASFKLESEQIDGAFTFNNNDYLFEGKWQESQCNMSDFDAFNGKLSRKLDNTLGLFCAINGFQDEAVKNFSVGKRSLMILMDGADLMAILDGRITLSDLLLRKRKHAAQTGNIYLKITEIINN